MLLSVVIPWSNKPDLLKTLRSVTAAAAHIDSEIIVVNCGGQDDVLTTMILGLDSVRTVNIRRKFNKSLAMNIGGNVACGERLLLLDADIVVPHNFFDVMFSELHQGTFLSVDRVFESGACTSADDHAIRSRRTEFHLELATGQVVSVPLNHIRYGDASRRGCGLMLLRRANFVSVDGMNSGLTGWGWEDNDLNLRLQARLGLSHRSIGDVIHLTHSDRERDLRGKSKIESEEDNFQQCLHRYERGIFTGTLDRDVKEWSGTELLTASIDPPTR
jgi:glycosyltransferase involved in cell wall biosynthesis